MQRFTISLDDELARQFDALTSNQGYVNRSEAVRDLIRAKVHSESLQGPVGEHRKATWCVANVSYVFSHDEQTVAARLLDMQHQHHDLIIASLHTHLDHENCMETVLLRGPVAAVQACAEHLIALRGVRHGKVHLVPLTGGDRHTHPGMAPHTHHKPIV
jgi:CopG family nickel-responsive transcriptional regulator